MTSTSDMHTDVAFFVKKYVKKFPISSKEKKRTCYNCDEDSHFANECPYEKKVDKPKFVKDEEKEAGVAGLAYYEPGPLFTYDYSKDYSTESSTPNDIGYSFMARTTHDDDSDDISPFTIVGSCLMAREAKVMESPPSLSSILDNDDNQDEVVMLKELYKVRCTLRGDALVKFDYLTESLKERDESIEELEYHLNDEKRRFNLLRQELKNKRLTKELAKFTTAKNKMGLDDLLSKQMLNNQKYGLGYAPKLYRKSNYKKEKPAQEKNKKVTNVGKASKGKTTNGDRTGPNNHYDLFVDYYGDVYDKYVGPRNGYAYRGYSIWGYSSGGPKWVFDSGCTNHMTRGRGVLDQFIEDINKKSSITFGDNSKGKMPAIIHILLNIE
ncbi:hypothetical protein QYE76_041221 [Lolium multiflorum]|uniref:CCHC-type domain-containing protein n=1 Tax=Lolium multiflorum TaxID=4521 RepID=A0AAD8WW70_LOLMU|nr:hypothetical protein QYE76_041221 [Lolium multiflorum]